MKILLEELAANSFAPFGKVIEQPARPCDASGPGWTWWGENLLLGEKRRNYALGYLDLKPVELAFDWAERHMSSDELVVPLGGDCVVYTAPPEFMEEPDHLPAFDKFRAFHVHSGQGVIFGKGVWHGAPLAFDAPAQALVLLLHGTGAQDAHVVHFSEKPIGIER